MMHVKIGNSHKCSIVIMTRQLQTNTLEKILIKEVF